MDAISVYGIVVASLGMVLLIITAVMRRRLGCGNRHRRKREKNEKVNH